MLTEFGVFTRKFRKTRGETMHEMADRLGITDSYLQMIECGKRNIPANIGDKLVRKYKLDELTKREVERVIELSQQSIQITLADKEIKDRDTILLFHKNFTHLSAKDKHEIRLLLEC